MYKTAHYHSTTHEALFVIRGSAKLLFGVSDKEDQAMGTEVNVGIGDILIVPAGVAHKALEDYDGFEMVGAYPKGASPWDMCYEHTPVSETKIPRSPVSGEERMAAWAEVEGKED